MKYCIANLSKIVPNFPHYWTEKPTSINIKDITVQCESHCGPTLKERENPSWLNYSCICITGSTACMSWAVRFFSLFKAPALAHQQIACPSPSAELLEGTIRRHLFVGHVLLSLSWFSLIMEGYYKIEECDRFWWNLLLQMNGFDLPSISEVYHPYWFILVKGTLPMSSPWSSHTLEPTACFRRTLGRPTPPIFSPLTFSVDKPLVWNLPGSSQLLLSFSLVEKKGWDNLSWH